MSSGLTITPGVPPHRHPAGSVTGLAAIATSGSAADITDATTAGRSLLTAVDAAAQRTALSVPSVAQVAAGYQPLDADLTAIAALTTTSYGRSLLTGADAAATRTLLGLAAIAASGSASDLGGTLADARLSGNVALLGSANSWAVGQTFNGTIYSGGGDIRRSVDNGYIVVSGSTAIDTTAARLEMLGKSHASAPNDINFFGRKKIFGAVNGAQQAVIDENGCLGLAVSPTAGNGLIQLASGVTEANGILMGDFSIFRSAAGICSIAAAVVLGSKASDPTGSNGMLYYDSTNNRLRAYANGAWKTVTVV